jgi:predicted ATPase
MIKEVQVQNFKQFRDHRFAFRPNGVTLLAGGNNSGKSTLLQALALWEFCRGAVESRKGRSALEGPYSGKGIAVTAQNFSPLALPSFEHLWTNLRPRCPRNANQTDPSYTLRVRCTWDETAAEGGVSERYLTFGLALMHERLTIKPVESNIPAAGRIPHCAYLPPFAGISDREERLSRGAQNRLIGRGLAGAALRNIVFDLHSEGKAALASRLGGRRRLSGSERREFHRSEPWHQLCDVLERIFKCELAVKPFDDAYSSTVSVLLSRGKLVNGKLQRFPGYRARDLMVEGSGFLQWLSVYALAVRRDVDVLLLDEPDAHLHPSLQAHLLDRLRSMARENTKQVLMATHSTEILKRVEPADIFAFDKRSRQYLSTDSQRVALFEGMGSEYSPKLDQLRQHRCVLFHEGSSDEEFLRIVAERYGRPLPRNLVFWQYAGGHSERDILFDQFASVIPGLKGLSIRDRDSLELGAVAPDLQERGRTQSPGKLRCRTWRRRQFENYLLIPSAIARAANCSQTEIEDFLQSIWGISSGSVTDLVRSDCSPGLIDARAKEALHEGLRGRDGEPAKQSVEQRFGCTRHQIARELQPEEIAADLKTLIDQIHSLCTD